jgi:hypothetical protein
MVEGVYGLAPNGHQIFPGLAVFGEQENQMRRVMEDLEMQSARAMEELVAGEGFGELMARFTANTVALTKISGDVMDLMLRNFRIAGRTDIDRLARQLARTEDKLELLLQAMERLEDTGQRG